MFKLSPDHRPPIKVKAVLNKQHKISQKKHELIPPVFNVDETFSVKPTEIFRF